MPPGYRIEVAGAVEESSKGQGSIAAGVPLMLFIMFTLLMLQLHSFSRVGAGVPDRRRSASPASPRALLLLDRPFGFVALLGVIALMGMIMRNSVILIDQIEQDRAARRRRPGTAIVEAAVRRFRPIVLTAAAAVLAMIPLSRSVFWGPMAVAIMGGLIVATALTLLALPAMYAAWFRVKREPARRSERRRDAASPARSAGLIAHSEAGAAQSAAGVASDRRARVAKLVDAPGLGPDASNGVRVRVRPRAPATPRSTSKSHHGRPQLKPSTSSSAGSP